MISLSTLSSDCSLYILPILVFTTHRQDVERLDVHGSQSQGKGMYPKGEGRPQLVVCWYSAFERALRSLGTFAQSMSNINDCPFIDHDSLSVLTRCCGSLPPYSGDPSISVEVLSVHLHCRLHRCLCCLLLERGVARGLWAAAWA